MSRIYFHSQFGEVYISGAERAAAGLLCSHLLAVSLSIDRHMRDDDGIFRLIPPDSHVHRAPSKAQALDMWLGGFLYEDFILPDGTQVDPFVAGCNTALVMGSDPVKLLARLHGQCELHCYVEGQNRSWLADIVDTGMEIGIFRNGMGWDGLAEFLRSRDDCPVVTSYSVCDQFPNATYIDADEEFYDLPENEQWFLAMEGLRKRARGLEMKPENWDAFFFEDGIHGYVLRSLADEMGVTGANG